MSWVMLLMGVGLKSSGDLDGNLSCWELALQEEVSNTKCYALRRFIIAAYAAKKFTRLNSSIWSYKWKAQVDEKKWLPIKSTS